METSLLFRPLGLQGLPSLQAWLPNLLRREVELSLEKLDLIWDHTYAWEMFLDMMVGGSCARCYQRDSNDINLAEGYNFVKSFFCRRGFIYHWHVVVYHYLDFAFVAIDTSWYELVLFWKKGEEDVKWLCQGNTPLCSEWREV